MKLISYIVLLLVLSGFSVNADNEMDGVIRLLRTGNTADAPRYLDDNVEIILPGKRNIYSRAQGLMVLKDFLETNGVTNFEVQQKVVNGRLHYCSGILYTRSGNYKATIFMTNKQGRQLMKEIRFHAT